MPNTYFQFKQFTIHQEKCAMKVCTDACILGSYAASKISPNIFQKFLDIGCGTGLLSLMLAQKINCSIDAIEIEEAAAKQAAENIEQSPWKDRIHVWNNSLQAFKATTKYDVVICNPPFFENDLRSADQQKNAAKHDTTLTLEVLLDFIKIHLGEEGISVVLLPYHRSSFFETEARKRSLQVKEKLLLRQTPQHAPFRTIMILSKQSVSETITKELIIHDEQRQYTSACKELLKDYYLAL